MYFDLGSNREERKFKIDKQGKPWKKCSQIFPLHLENIQNISNVKKKNELTNNNYYICWDRKIKLHLIFKTCTMDLWQQQHEVFSTSSLETINFSLPASCFYVVTVWALRKMQNLCHVCQPGRGLTVRADSWLWHGAAVAPQITALCKGHVRRSCEKLCWGSLSLWELQVSSGPELRRSCACAWPCALLSLTWWHDFLAWPWACLIATGLCGSHRSVGWTWSPLLYMLFGFGWCGTASLVREVTIPVCLVVTLGFWLTFPCGAAPVLLLLNNESTLFYLQSQDWGLH